MNVFYRLKNSVETIAQECWEKLSPEHKEKFETLHTDEDVSHKVTDVNGEVHLVHATDPVSVSVNMNSISASL